MFATLNFSSPKQISSHTSIEQKTKAQKSAHAFMDHVKNGSPRLKKLVRETCRLRMKEARCHSFQFTRNLQSHDKNMISKLLQEEIAEFEKDVELQNLIVEEMLQDTENWFIEELQNEMKKQENYLVEINEKSIVFCPVCERFNLKLVQNNMLCNCGISFSYDKSLDAFVTDMQNIIANHEEKCEHKLNFYLEPTLNANTSKTLFCLCEHCDYLCSL